MRIKKLAGIIFTAAAFSLLTACGKTNNQKNQGTPTIPMTPTVTAEPTKEADPTAVPTKEPTAGPTATTKPTPTLTPVPVDRTAARELVAKMNVGWNLGNTFDAHGAAKPVDNETYWKNPFTTREMLQAVWDQGFNSIRIPVTFGSAIGKAPEYTIDEEMLARVETVIRDCLDIGFYVVLDTHHEPDTWLKPQNDGLPEVEAKLTAIWTQLANRFADCDEHLIFEGMNEPRIKGSKEEWSGGTKEGRYAVNTLNRAFVNAVRATGGNNETRLLVLATYGNAVTITTMFDLYIPADPYLAVAVHLYTPYNFTFEPENDRKTFDKSQKTDITGNFDQVKKYVADKGVPVMITEFGAVNKTITSEDGIKTTNLESRLQWLQFYMEEANKRGYKCFWWDNGIHDSSGEKFGIFDRRTLTWLEPEIADALIEFSMKSE